MNGSIYNVASGIETTIEKVIHIFIEKLNFNTEITFSNQVRKGDPLNWCADISKMKSIGFASDILIEEGLEDLSSWLNNFKS